VVGEKLVMVTDVVAARVVVNICSRPKENDE
jgi:hypothetical protein